MTAYVMRRLLGLIPVLIGVTLLIFVITRLIPGDPAVAMLGQRASAEALQALRENMGFTKPIWLDVRGFLDTGNVAKLFDSQYFQYMGSLLQFDFGQSIFSRIPVSESLLRRFPATIELTVVAMIFALVIGIPAGVWAALRRGTFADTAVMTLALSGVSFPVFWLAIIMIYIFAVQLGWFPPSGRLSTGIDLQPVTGLYVLDSIITGNIRALGDVLSHLILPAAALGTIPLAIVVRMTRSSMLEVLSQDYIRTARSKGLAERIVVNKHAFRNALLPVVTVVGLSFGTLLSGAILTETVFSWPGIGRWVYDAISARDYPIIQGGVLFVAFIFVLINLAVDLSYAIIDPRIQYS